MEARNAVYVVVLVESERDAVKGLLARVAHEAVYVVDAAARAKKFVTDRSVARSTLFERVL